MGGVNLIERDAENCGRWEWLSDVVFVKKRDHRYTGGHAIPYCRFKE